MLPKIHGLLGKILTSNGSYLNINKYRWGRFIHEQAILIFFLANTNHKKLNENSLTCRGIVHGRTAVNVSMTLAPLILLINIQSTC